MDVMEIVWVIIPITFLLCMQVRSFKKMQDEKTQLLVDVEQTPDLVHPDDHAKKNAQLNRSELHVEPQTPGSGYASVDQLSLSSAIKPKF